MDGAGAEVRKESGHVVGVSLHGRRRRAGREELAAEIAANHLKPLPEARRDGLPRGEAHHSAVQKEKGLTLPVDAVCENVRKVRHSGSSEKDFFER